MLCAVQTFGVFGTEAVSLKQNIGRMIRTEGGAKLLLLCEESCVARYRHVHLSPDFTSQEFRIEPNVSTTIQSSLSVAIQNRGVRLSTLWGGEVAGNQSE